MARQLAAHFGLAYLDTGSLYRAVALQVSINGEKAENDDAAVRAASELDASLLGDPRLRSGKVGEAASVVAANPKVREEVLGFQRRFAAAPEGAVLDGRDIGTIVCPHADVKIFVVADSEVRATRRFEELQTRGEDVSHESVLADLRARDARDQGRSVAPLKRADDSLLHDTSELDIETAFKVAVSMIDGQMSAN